MNAVTLVFSRKHHIGSLLLRAFLWSGWSHVAIVDGEDVIEAVAGDGVRRRPMAALLAESSEFVVVSVPALNAQAVVAAAASQIGKPYDWRGVLGIGFRRRWQDADSWFCSELVAWAFREAGHPLFRLDEWRITPRDLYGPIFMVGPEGV